MADIAELVVEVNTAPVERGMRALTEFNRTAERTDAVWTSVQRAFVGGMREGLSASERMADAIERNAREMQRQAEAVSRLGAAMNQVENAGQSLLAQFGLFYGLDAFRTVFTQVKELMNGLVEVERVAKLANTSLGGVFAGQMSAQQSTGLRASDYLKGVEGLSEQLNEARIKEQEIGKLFQANGIALKDRNGDVMDFNTALAHTSELVRGAQTAWDKIKIAESVGLTKEWVPYLEQGAEKIWRMQAAAEVLTADQKAAVDQAKEFEKAWNAITATGTNLFQQEIIALIGKMKELVDEIRQMLALIDRARNAVDSLAEGQRAAALNREINARSPFQVQSLTRRAEAEEERAEILERQTFRALGMAQQRSNLASQAQRWMDGLQQATGAQEIAGPPPAGVQAAINAARNRGPTRRPTDDDADGGGKSASDEFDRMTKRIEDQTRRLAEQAATFGRSAGEVARYRAEQELLTAALRAEREITPELRDRIGELAGKYAEAATKVEELRQKAQQSRELQQFIGTNLISSLDEAIERGGKLSDIFDNVASAIRRAALQAVILGQGPFAGLFGTAAAPGSNMTGGLVGSLFSMFRSGSGGGLPTMAQGGFGPDIPAGVLHSGGMVGHGGLMRYMHPAYFDDAPRLHSGLAADEFPAILQRGEQVIPRGQVGAGAAGPVTVNVNNNGSPVAAEAEVTRSSGRALNIDLTWPRSTGR